MKGMQKIKRGTGFRGALEYALDERGQLIGGNMSGETVRELATEFGQSRKLREDIEKPVWHNSLRLPEQERISPEKWTAIADDYMKKMGFSALHQRVYVLHDDPDGQHIHVIASRIGLDKSLYLGQQENLISTQVIHELEKIYGLSLHSVEVDPLAIRQNTFSAKEKGLAKRTGEPPLKFQLQTFIDHALRGKPTFQVFVARLEAENITVEPSGKTGRNQGITFGLDGIGLSGSKLGEAYKWGPLQKRLDFDADRDQPVIDTLRAQAAQRIENGTGELTAAITVIEPPVAYQGFQRTLDLAFTKTGNQYTWKGWTTVALIDEGDRIRVLSPSDSAVKASLQLAREKGWTSVHAQGGADFRRKTWLMGLEMGLTVSGYTPSTADQEELNQRLQLKKDKNNERKSRRMAKTSPGPSGNREDHGRAGDTDRSVIDDAGAVERRTDGIEPASQTGTAAVRGSHQKIISGEKGYRATAGNDTRRTQAHKAGSHPPESARDAAVDHDDFVRTHLRRIDLVVNTLTDRAAASSTQPAERDDRSNPVKQNKRVSAAQYAKQQQWQTQSKALAADQYRLTLVPRGLADKTIVVPGKNGSQAEKLYSASEVHALIPFLSRRNAQGYDVYLTPLSAQYDYILVDRVTATAFDALKMRYTPSVVQQLPAGHVQVVLKTPRNVELAATHYAAKSLNTRYGDPRIDSANLAFRMAGFVNKKAAKRDPDALVLTTLLETHDVVCPTLSELIATKAEQLRVERVEQQKKEAVQTERQRRIELITLSGSPSSADPQTPAGLYPAEAKAIVQGTADAGKGLDWSSVDYRVAARLFINLHRVEDIKAALIDGSPELADWNTATEAYLEKLLETLVNDETVMAAYHKSYSIAVEAERLAALDPSL